MFVILTYSLEKRIPSEDSAAAVDESKKESPRKTALGRPSFVRCAALAASNAPKKNPLGRPSFAAVSPPPPLPPPSPPATHVLRPSGSQPSPTIRLPSRPKTSFDKRGGKVSIGKERGEGEEGKGSWRSFDERGGGVSSEKEKGKGGGF